MFTSQLYKIMFTDRYIKVPVDLYANAELIGYNENSKSNTVMYRINPLEVSVYRESSGEGVLTGETTIWMKNGEVIVIALSIDEFEKLLNDK